MPGPGVCVFEGCPQQEKQKVPDSCILRRCEACSEGWSTWLIGNIFFNRSLYFSQKRRSSAYELWLSCKSAAPILTNSAPMYSRRRPAPYAVIVLPVPGAAPISLTLLREDSHDAAADAAKAAQHLLRLGTTHSSGTHCASGGVTVRSAARFNPLAGFFFCIAMPPT